MHVAFTKIKAAFAVEIVFFTIFGCDAAITYHTYPQIISLSTPYAPKVVKKSCLLKPDYGPCRANISMYHYSPSKGMCFQFNWGGCQGNGNRFDSMAECYDACLSKPNEKDKPPRYCELSFDYGYCFGDVKRWYYDPLWKSCKETLYSGCGGNKNNFYSIEACESVCRFGRKFVNPNLKKDGLRKVIVVNSLKATTAKSRIQN